MKFNVFYNVSILIAFTSVSYYLLVINSFICSTYHFVEYIIPNLCLSVSKRNSSVSIISEELYFNDFCEYLCSSNLEYICHTYHLSKPFVFTFYEEGKTQKYILKAIIEDNENEDAYWKQKSENPYLPSAQELKKIVNSHVNFFVAGQESRLLNPINSSLYTVQVGDLSIHEEFWKLIYDHEFLTSFLFQNFSLFPRILGTCKNFYAVQYAKPLIGNPLFPLSIPTQTKIQKAIELLSFIRKLNLAWLEPIHLCDIKHDHFGWLNGEVLFLDLDCVVTDSALKDIFVNNPECTVNEDCSYFDCHGECLPNKRCSKKRKNTNLQVLCSKIFLGNSESSIMGLYGLLSGYEFSDALKEALDVCATNPGMTVEVLVEILQDEYKSTTSLL
ncbi:UNVERIFIED_CONTAM: hypothetical protein RMT77_003145 [Armadillidium vulgare]